MRCGCVGQTEWGAVRPCRKVERDKGSLDSKVGILSCPTYET